MESVTLDTPAGGLHAARWRPDTPDATRSPIVLLHDSLGCVALWRDFPARLAEASGREVIAYDRQGYGKSAPCPGPQPASFIADEAEFTPRNAQTAEARAQLVYAAEIEVPNPDGVFKIGMPADAYLDALFGKKVGS